MLPEAFAVVCAPQHTPKYVDLFSGQQEQANICHLVASVFFD